jgi:hypothetical protein
MAEIELTSQAINAYKTLCACLDEQKWKYEKDDENLFVFCTVTGEDLPIKIGVRFDPKREFVHLLSRLPLTIPEDKRIEANVLVSAINYSMVHGLFEYDINKGEIDFRINTSFKDSLLSKELFSYLIYVSCMTIDKYNDQLLMYSTGKLTLEKIIENIYKD